MSSPGTRQLVVAGRNVLPETLKSNNPDPLRCCCRSTPYVMPPPRDFLLLQAPPVQDACVVPGTNCFWFQDPRWFRDSFGLWNDFYYPRSKNPSQTMQTLRFLFAWLWPPSKRRLQSTVTTRSVRCLRLPLVLW